MKRKLIQIIIVLGIFLLLLLLYLKYNNNQEISYMLGKTPHSYLMTFVDDKLLYKDDVKVNDNFEFSGLYLKGLEEGINSTNEVLLTDNYNSCANYYDESVIYIDNEYNIQQIDLHGKNQKTIIKNNGLKISNVLIINHILYYLQEKEEDLFSLYAFNLIDNHKKELLQGVNFRFLYDYCGSVGVISQIESKFMICNYDNGTIKIYDNPEFEIQGFLKDGSLVYYENNMLCMKRDFDSSDKKVLFEDTNIYRIIMHSEEMIISTLDTYGMIEVFLYDFINNEAKKIANSNYLPRDFNDKYIVCCSEDGVGSVELIDRDTGDIKIFSSK